jgi:hypothetical protein
MTKAKLQKQIDDLNYQHIEYCKIANQRNIDVNEKLNRLIDYLGLEEKEEEYIGKVTAPGKYGPIFDVYEYPYETSVIKTKKYFIKKKK